MRIRILSDLHQEFGEIDVPDVACDAVVLAGDISTKLNGLHWIRRRFADIPVVYICGNHEYYGARLPSITDKLRAACRETNIHFLEDSAVELHGYWFVGAVLWTDFALHGDWQACAGEAGSVMNDYKRVRNSSNGYRKLKVQDTRMLHLASVAHLRQFLGTHQPDRTVVVTHHAPSILSLPEQRRTELISGAYASNLDTLIEEHQPLLWVHGHIHHRNDYRLGRTRIVANPRAYPDTPNASFDPTLVVNLDDQRAARDAAGAS